MPPERLDGLTQACVIAWAQGWFDPTVQAPTQKQLLDAVSDMQKHARRLRNRLETLPGALGPNLYSADIDVAELSGSLTALEQACDSLRPGVEAYKKTGKSSTNPITLIRRALPSAIRSSSSPGSPFREIIGICYEAMGAAKVDPERAIKAWIKSRSRHVEFDATGALEGDADGEAYFNDLARQRADGKS